MAESRVMRFEIIRDPLWDNIRVDELALRLVDAPEFQRLRYVRQLGLTYLVYPGATQSCSPTRSAPTRRRASTRSSAARAGAHSSASSPARSTWTSWST